MLMCLFKVFAMANLTVSIVHTFSQANLRFGHVSAIVMIISKSAY